MVQAVSEVAMLPEQSFDMFVCVNLRLLPPVPKVTPPLLSNVSGKCATTSENTAHSMKYTHSVLDAGLSLTVVPFQIQHGLYVLLNMLHVFSCSSGRLPVSILKQNVIYTFCHANPFYFCQKLLPARETVSLVSLSIRQTEVFFID